MGHLIIIFSVLTSSITAYSADLAPDPTPVATAQESTSNDSAKADVHKTKARILIEQKDWSGAAEEIRQATQLNPKSADAWLIHGTVTMRLEKNAEALDAFNKYLALNPPVDKAAAVRQRVAELEVRLDKERKIKEAADQARAAEEQAAAKKEAERYGPLGTGIFIGYSPLFKPRIGTDSDLNSSVSSSFDFGFRFALLDVGVRYATGTVDRITVREKGDLVTGPFRNGKHTLWEGFGRIYFALNELALGKAGSQFLIPLKLSMYVNNAQFKKTYWNMGLSAGTGMQFRYYTGSLVAFDLTGLYCLSYPITPIQNNDADIKTAYNSKNDKIAGKLDGYELRAGLALLF